jgi:hypothetical protein
MARPPVASLSFTSHAPARSGTTVSHLSVSDAPPVPMARPASPAATLPAARIRADTRYRGMTPSPTGKAL